MDTSINPQMLLLARQVRGMTQKELAKATEIDQGLISRYEHQEREISLTDLKKIADVLQFAVEFFKRNEMVYGPDVSAIYHRKRVSLPKKKQEQVDARLNILRMDIQKLLDNADIESPFEFPRYNPEDYDEDIEHIASLVRATWKMPVGPVANVVDAIENAGGVILPIDVETSQFDGVVQHIPPSPPVFLVNSKIPGDRLRFTLAHEIGHLVMHSTPNPNAEAQADAFASAFLMPAHDILTDFYSVKLEHLAQLKPKWKVSIQSLIRRAKDLGRISDRQYRSLNIEMSSAGYKTNEPLPIPYERPKLIQELLDIHVQDFGYNGAALCNLFNIQEWELKQVYYMEPPTLHIVRKYAG